MAAVVESSGGYLIFEVDVCGFTNERKGVSVYGNNSSKGPGTTRARLSGFGTRTGTCSAERMKIPSSDAQT
ncbi:MAG: hypothetical protein ACETVY_05010 [Candidatus Bathyarchaeia archaeon]